MKKYIVTTPEQLIQDVVELRPYFETVMRRRFRVNRFEDREDVFQDLLLRMWDTPLPKGELWDFKGWVRYRLAQSVSRWLSSKERWQRGRTAFALSFPQMILEQSSSLDGVHDNMAIADFMEFLEKQNMPDYAKEYLYLHFVEGVGSLALSKNMGRSRTSLYTWKLYFLDKLEKVDAETETLR